MEDSSPIATDDVDNRINDPAPTMPYDVIANAGLLRLRQYRPANKKAAGPPVLIIYPLVKRPFVLDLVPTRSVVRSLLEQGLTVYLTDWIPPGPDDRSLGLDEYVNVFVATAVSEIQQRENVERVSLVGCCCGSLLSVVFAALHPQDIERLVTIATPIEARQPVDSMSAEFMRRLYGNIPDWLLRSVFNARVPTRAHLAQLLANDLGEPDLANFNWSDPPEFLLAVERWMASDVALTGKLFIEVVRDVLGNRHLCENRLEVGDQRVDLGRIQCPVLSISGVRDELVPPGSGARFVELVGSTDATHWMFPTGHLGLMISRRAQLELWPRIGEWLRGEAITDGLAQQSA